MVTWDQDINTVITRYFNFQWYENLRKRFSSNKYYNQDINEIENPTTYFIDDGTCGDVIEIQHNETFFTYCWLGISQDIGETEENKTNKTLIFGYDITLELVKAIKYHLPMGDIETSNKMIKSSIAYIEELFEKFKKVTPHVEYALLLNNMFEKISEWLNASFRDIIALDVLREKTVDKLTFNINQDQLASLLHLLKESEILNLETTQDLTNFYSFCNKYFYCNKRGVGYAPIKDSKIRINDIKNKQAPDALDKVMKDLKNAYDRYS